MKHTIIFAFVPILFYVLPMPHNAPIPRPSSSLSVKIGRWAEAQATGWGIVALVVLAVLGAVVALSRSRLLG